MKRSTAIIGIGALLTNPLQAFILETPQYLWEKKVTKKQKEFAYRCIRYGERYGRGHTLAGIGWMESWFGDDIDHIGEPSRGPFGIKPSTAISTIINPYRKEIPYDLDIIRNKVVPDNLDYLLDNDFKFNADICLVIFYDNHQYFMDKGWSSSAAWRYAYQMYNAGYKWKKKHGRGIIFSERVKFLKSVNLPKTV